MIRNMKHRGQAYPGTQAVLRAVRLLKAFGPAQGELALGDLVRLVGLNKTTTYRLLTALEAEGLVQRGPGGEGYRLGPELLALGSRALGASDLRHAGRGELSALASATRETASLEVLVGAHALILDEAMGSHLVGTTPSVGTRWPAHAASSRPHRTQREVTLLPAPRPAPAPAPRRSLAPAASLGPHPVAQ